MNNKIDRTKTPIVRPIDDRATLLEPEVPKSDASVRQLKSKTIFDREYTLFQRLCSNCEVWHYEIYRWCGASFSRYHMAAGFEAEDFEYFVEGLDERLLESAADMIQDFHRSLTSKNSELGIEADGSFAFRLLEYGRHRISRLQKLHMLDVIISNDKPKTSKAEAVRVAFELGMATAEFRLLDTYEDYLLDGMAMSEWRESGLPRAREERIRLGKVTHKAVVEAARTLYSKDQLLVRNDSETARRIRALNIPELEKGGGITVGVDAITRHLRSARHLGEL